MLLVTGITGYSGSYFLKELIKHKYDGKIRCIVRETSDTSLIDKSGLKIDKVTGDLNDQNFINRTMIGIDTVLHIGSIFYSVSVIKAAAKNNVRRTILVHTTGIYSKYKSASEDYKNIELEINKIIKKNDFQIGLIILRPTMIYGNINDKNMIIFIKMVDKLRFFPIINHGKNLLQPVNARDLGKAYYKVIMKADILNGDYILSGEKPITMFEMLKTISNILGKKTTFVNVPLEFGIFLARVLKILTLGKIDYIEKVQRMGEDRHFSHEEAIKDFSYSPMSFTEGLEIEIKQYIENAKSKS